MSIFSKIKDLVNPEKKLSDVGDEGPDKQLIDFLYKTLYIESVNYDKAYAKNREDNRKFYKGDQWRRSQPSDKSKSVTNFLSLYIRDEVSILTDNAPEMNVRPADYKGDTETALNLKKLLYHVNYKNNLQEKTYKAVKLTSIENISYFRPVWNPLLSDGMGDIEILVEKADSIKRDPSGEDNYFCIEKKVTMAEIARLYPDKFKEVSADKKDQRTIADSTNKSLPSRPVTSTDGSETVIYDKQPSTIQEQMDKVDFHIWWLRDSSVRALDPEKEGEEPQTVELYPNGRWVTIANRKVILKDEACKTKNFPIVPLILDYDPETDINGISTIDYCKQMQIDYNEIRALQKDWTRAATFLSYTYDPKSRIDPKKIKNRSWARAIPASPNDFRWDAPPPLPNESWRDLQESKSNMEYVSGINEATQGRRPASVQSAEAVRLLQESSKTILRPKARLLEAALKKLGQLEIEYIQLGYTTNRMIRILGLDKGMGEDLEINTPEVVDNVEKIKNDLSIGEYDVYVEPDSTLPRSEVERFDRVMNLAKESFVDRLAVLEQSGLPNWQEIEERMALKEKEFKEQQNVAQENEQLKQQIEEMSKQLQSMPQGKAPNESINFKDMPPNGQAQMAAKVGIQLNPQEVVENQERLKPPVSPKNNQVT